MATSGGHTPDEAQEHQCCWPVRQPVADHLEVGRRGTRAAGVRPSSPRVSGEPGRIRMGCLDSEDRHFRRDAPGARDPVADPGGVRRRGPVDGA